MPNFNAFASIFGPAVAEAGRAYTEALVDLPKYRDEQEELAARRELRPLQKAYTQEKLQSDIQKLHRPEIKVLPGGHGYLQIDPNTGMPTEHIFPAAARTYAQQALYEQMVQWRKSDDPFKQQAAESFFRKQDVPYGRYEETIRWHDMQDKQRRDASEAATLRMQARLVARSEDLDKQFAHQRAMLDTKLQAGATQNDLNRQQRLTELEQKYQYRKQEIATRIDASMAITDARIEATERMKMADLEARLAKDDADLEFKYAKLAQDRALAEARLDSQEAIALSREMTLLEKSREQIAAQRELLSMRQAMPQWLKLAPGATAVPLNEAARQAGQGSPGTLPQPSATSRPSYQPSIPTRRTAQAPIPPSVANWPAERAADDMKISQLVDQMQRQQTPENFQQLAQLTDSYIQKWGTYPTDTFVDNGATAPPVATPSGTATPTSPSTAPAPTTTPARPGTLPTGAIQAPPSPTAVLAQKRLDLNERRFARQLQKDELQAWNQARQTRTQYDMLDNANALGDMIEPLLTPQNVAVPGSMRFAGKNLSEVFASAPPREKTQFKSHLEQARQKALEDAQINKSDAYTQSVLSTPITGTSNDIATLRTLSSIIAYTHALAIKNQGSARGQGVTREDLAKAERLFDPTQWLASAETLKANLGGLRMFLQDHRKPTVIRLSEELPPKLFQRWLQDHPSAKGTWEALQAEGRGQQPAALDVAVPTPAAAPAADDERAALRQRIKDELLKLRQGQ